MRLRTKSRFAVTAMVDLALRHDHGPVSLSAISGRHQFSLSYLEQLFSKLRQSGLVQSTRGPGGGYTLARATELISVADIVLAVDKPNAADEEDPQAQESWMKSEAWTGLTQQVMEHLSSITLRQLVLDELARGVQVEEPKHPGKSGVFAKPKLQNFKSNAPNSVFALAGTLLAKNRKPASR